MPDLRTILRRYYPVILLVIIVAISIDLLGFSDILTRPILNEREQDAVLDQLKETLPDMVDSVLIDDVYVALSAEDSIIAYAFIVSGMGYGGEIDTLVVLENATTISSIYIIKQTETPGLGGLITLPDFTDRFTGQKIEDVKLKRDGGVIDGIPWATISSRAVIDTVRILSLERAQTLPSAGEVEEARLAKKDFGR